jgi:hypothetical protein
MMYTIYLRFAFHTSQHRLPRADAEVLYARLKNLLHAGVTLTLVDDNQSVIEEVTT